MVKFKRVQDFGEDKFALEFESYEDLDAAVHILGAWEKQMDLLLECARSTQENGKALQKYGDWDAIEGRIRQLVGGEIADHAEILLMETRTGGISAALSRMEAITGKILHTLRNTPDEFLAFIEENPPPKGLMVREKAQEALDTAKARLAELDAGADPEYESERYDVERVIEFETRVLAVKEQDD